jgi:beta-galactosidase
MKLKRILIFLVALVQISAFSHGQSGRWDQNLSGYKWNLWLDKGASWYDDDIYMPPVDVTKLPVNPPTCGWDALHSGNSLRTVNVPGTVEEHYWGRIGGATSEGNYVGVSWWSRKFHLDNNLNGKKITLAFQSVNLRAEVFVNGKLVGYDVIGNTPFEVDATNAVVFGQDNYLDVRITDPVGNFSWNDNNLMRWGKNFVPAVHGFGGITGDIILRATDAVSVSDIYVQNQPDPKKVNIIVTLNNYTGSAKKGQLLLNIHEKGNANAVVWTKTSQISIPGSTVTVSIPANVPQAELWEISVNKSDHKARLYEASVRFTSTDKKIVDNSSQRFGFRWFDVGEKDGDKRFYLNGKRVFIIAAMARGIWPTNGMTPTPKMVNKEVNTMLDMGFNMMLLHRAIGQPGVFDYADSVGFFTYEEPGGYRVLGNSRDSIIPDEQAYNWRREKVKRMILRDRSFPSLVIYNLKNEEHDDPTDLEISDMNYFHQLDPSRILTYNSGNKHEVRGPEYYNVIPNDPMETYIAPFNPKQITGGWWDHHHWYSYSGYTDEMWRNPMFYRGGINDAAAIPLLIDSLYPLNKSQILFNGEEGAFSAIVRLQKIKEEIENTPANGYREQEHLDWFNAYDKFLDEAGFREAFPNVDSLTVSMGRNIHYFQARNLENIRLSNISDAYVANGWASESTRTDLVDAYRNPTSHPSIFRYFTRPLYVAVKLRNKVISTGAEPIADFFIVNESDLKGKHTLNVTLNDPSGNIIFNQSHQVDIKGGEEFGQLLVENIKLPAISTGGYFKLNATITDNSGNIKTTGFDKIYSVDINENKAFIGNCAVLESDTTIQKFLSRTRKINAVPYSPEIPEMNVIVIGTYDFAKVDPKMMADLLKRAQSGTKLIVLSNADKFAQQIDLLLKTRPFLFVAPPTSQTTGFGGRGGSGTIANLGGGGRLFVGLNALLTGLPQAQSMSWEYQCFYKGAGSVMGDAAIVQGIRLNWMRADLIVGLGSASSKEIFSALSRVPVGNGSVTLSTLNMIPNLRNNFPSATVAKKLFLNMMEY